MYLYLITIWTLTSRHDTTLKCYQNIEDSNSFTMTFSQIQINVLVSNYLQGSQSSQILKKQCLDLLRKVSSFPPSFSKITTSLCIFYNTFFLHQLSTQRDIIFTNELLKLLIELLFEWSSNQNRQNQNQKLELKSKPKLSESFNDNLKITFQFLLQLVSTIVNNLVNEKIGEFKRYQSEFSLLTLSHIFWILSIESIHINVERRYSIQSLEDFAKIIQDQIEHSPTNTHSFHQLSSNYSLRPLVFESNHFRFQDCLGYTYYILSAIYRYSSSSFFF